jgi:hypothetical protein
MISTHDLDDPSCTEQSVGEAGSEPVTDDPVREERLRHEWLNRNPGARGTKQELRSRGRGAMPFESFVTFQKQLTYDGRATDDRFAIAAARVSGVIGLPM